MEASNDYTEIELEGTKYFGNHDYWFKLPTFDYVKSSPIINVLNIAAKKYWAEIYYREMKEHKEKK